jgi:hypothetical protein
VQRILVAMSGLAALAAAGLLAVTLGAHTVRAHALAARPAHSRTAVPLPAATRRRLTQLERSLGTLQATPALKRPQGQRRAVVPMGTACYVDTPRCSQTPCVVYVQSDAVLRPAIPGVRLGTQARNCAQPKVASAILRGTASP